MPAASPRPWGFFSPARLRATTYYWTTGSGTPAAAGNGAWATSGAANWETNSSGSALAAWAGTTADTANFCADSAGTSTVTVNGSVSVGTIAFTGSGYDVTGGTITLPSSGLGTITTAKDAEIDSVIAGGAQLDKEGPGTLYLTNPANTFYNSSGILLNGGTLNFANGSLHNNNLNFNGGTLQWATGNTQDISAGINIANGGPISSGGQIACPTPTATTSRSTTPSAAGRPDEARRRAADARQ